VRLSAVMMVWRETLASAGVAASFSGYYRMTVGAADLAFAYFGLDCFDGVSCENHVGDVVLFVSYVVELEDAVVGGTAVCAFTEDAFVSVYEGFVSVALVAVLLDACFWVGGVPFGVALFRAGLAGRLQAVLFAFVLGELC
jgi:hypothetical protein